MPASSPAARVLIVDDDLGLLRLLEKALQREGYATATARSGREAQDWLAKNQADLMLLDLKLEDTGGKELVARLAAGGRALPFIIITGQGDERVAVEMMKSGALDYLVKDFRFQEFVPTVVARALAQVRQEKKLSAAEAALKRESAFSQAIFETSGGILMVLDKDFRIVRFNRAAERASGFTLAEVVGKHPWDCLLPKAEKEPVRQFLQRLAAGESAVDSENKWLTRQGESRSIAWSRTALRGNGGELEYVISAGIDITERKQLEAELLQAGEAERRRIGHDLHDGICQHLAGIELMTQVLHHELAGTAKAAAAQAEKIARHVREAISQTRMLARGLSPVSIEPNGLMSALQELATRFSEIFGIECRFECPEPILVSDSTAATHLFRIAQEALNNAYKHGRARKINIRLRRHGSGAQLTVTDQGSGIAKNGAEGTGMGLRIMGYRAGMIGASLEVRPGRGKGTSVICNFKCEPPGSME
jgi:PAS domain S-box-containing protein